MHDVSAHEHHQSHEYLWEELEQPLAVPPCMLLHSNTEAPTELLVSVSSALSAWSPPELEETVTPPATCCLPASLAHPPVRAGGP